MRVCDFESRLFRELLNDKNSLQTNNKDWIVKGFIDIYKNIYTISVDTKVISKIVELMLFPTLSRFAIENNLEMVFACHQNHYPDISFVDNTDGTKIALDIKTTYRTGSDTVNGFTLGAFTGYFRNRNSNKNITFKYDEYNAHCVLGIIYSKNDTLIDERKIYKLEDINNIISVVSDFDFIVQEKYKIANTRPGSGNTKNIGSITNITRLKNGDGPFAKLGVDIFDDYWMYYLTKDMAPDKVTPYSNFKEYIAYKNRTPSIELTKDMIEEIIVEEATESEE